MEIKELLAEIVDPEKFPHLFDKPYYTPDTDIKSRLSCGSTVASPPSNIFNNKLLASGAESYRFEFFRGYSHKESTS